MVFSFFFHVICDCRPTATLERFTSQTEGILLTLGQGDMGQLGLGEDIMERRRPAVVKDLEDIPMRQVVCGGMHTVAMTTEGKVSSTWMACISSGVFLSKAKLSLRK